MSRSFKPIPAESADGDASAVGTKRSVPQIPVSAEGEGKALFPPLVLYPNLPSASEADVTAFSAPWPSPVAELPSVFESSKPESDGKFREIVLPSSRLRRDGQETERKIEKPIFPSASKPVSHSEVAPESSAAPQVAQSPFTAAPQLDQEYNDKDLKEALAPIMQDVVREAVYAGERSNVNAMLEPMLRATVRRALAEYSPAHRPFEAPGFMDRTVWRMQALFSSRTYEDVLFEKTHRFQVDEVFLYDAKTLALVSFASCDPARHSAAKRIESSAHRIAIKLRDESGNIRRSYERVDGRNVIAEVGEHVMLAAVVRGQPNEVILADLAFCLHRIEDHFRERFEQAGSALMHALQPFLEDCLLIQAPASAA
ncbi:MAG: hypothetical protein ABJQ29_16420 [Luteolibacter sp.]